MSGEVMIDAALFLGMHHVDDSVRRACKAFFVTQLTGRVTMSLEQVGLCDDVIWGHPRELQDAYYPFMDVLHTDMKIDRLGYTEADLAAARDDPALADLPLGRRLSIGMAVNRGAVLHTVDPVLLARTGLPVQPVAAVQGEPSFPGYLEELYAASLVLRTGANPSATR